MDVEIKRDGIILRGKIEKPYNTDNKKISDKYPALIIFHGFAGNLGYFALVFAGKRFIHTILHDILVRVE